MNILKKKFGKQVLVTATFETAGKTGIPISAHTWERSHSSFPDRYLTTEPVLRSLHRHTPANESIWYEWWKMRTFWRKR